MDAQSINGANFCTNTGLLTGTGAETVYDTTVAIDYCINGKAYRKAAVTDGATPTSDGNGDALPAVPDDKGCVLLWTLNAAGVVALFQGDLEDLDVGGEFDYAPSFPSVPDTVVPFAYTVIKNTTGSDFTVGTTNWGSGTATHVNIMTMPDRPQES